jgi:hypothetical protein
VDIPGQVPQDRRGRSATRSLGNTVLIRQLATSYSARIDIGKMLAELRAERDQLDEAIWIFAGIAARAWQTPGPFTGLDVADQAPWQATAQGSEYRMAPILTPARFARFWLAGKWLVLTQARCFVRSVVVGKCGIGGCQVSTLPV